MIVLAHDDHLGYITSCPTNLGTALRASVHIALPKLGARKEEFEKIALDYLPTAMDELKTITGSDQINPVCCQSVSKLVADKCACEKTPMSFLDGMLEKKGLKISDYIGLAKTVMGKMGCDAANDLQVYPQCTA